MPYNVDADSFHFVTFFKRSAILDGKQPFFVFEPPFRGLEVMYDDHLRLIGKRVVDFLSVLIKLFR